MQKHGISIECPWSIELETAAYIAKVIKILLLVIKKGTSN